MRELRLSLEALMTTLSSLGCKTTNLNELERFLKSLSQHDELSLLELSSRLDGSAPGSEVTRRERADPADADLVSGYAERFRAAQLDRLGYLALVTELQADPKMRMGEMSALAQQLTSVDAKYKNKKAAVDAIRAWVQRKLDTARRLEGTAKLF